MWSHQKPWEFATARIEGSLSLIHRHGRSARARHTRSWTRRSGCSWAVLHHHGIRSMNVAVWLRNQGFEQAQPAAARGHRRMV